MKSPLRRLLRSDNTGRAFAERLSAKSKQGVQFL